jgi:hypothetical protein
VDDVASRRLERSGSGRSLEGRLGADPRHAARQSHVRMSLVRRLLGTISVPMGPLASARERAAILSEATTDTHDAAVRRIKESQIQ